MKINGTPQPANKAPRKKVDNGGRAGGSSGCALALVTVGLLGAGWVSMLLTSAGVT